MLSCRGARRKLIVLLWHTDRPVRERVLSYARSVPLRGVRMFYSYSPHGARPFLIWASGKLRESRKPRYDFGPCTRGKLNIPSTGITPAGVARAFSTIAAPKLDNRRATCAARYTSAFDGRFFTRAEILLIPRATQMSWSFQAFPRDRVSQRESKGDATHRRNWI